MSDPRCEGLLIRLASRTAFLWKEGGIEVPRFPLTAGLKGVLYQSLRAGRIVRGLEGAERRLSLEHRGLRPTGSRPVPVSRLILMSDDGSQRFYRRVAGLLGRYSPRVFALLLEADAYTLGSHLYGRGRLARLVMLTHKEAVSAAFLAMAGEGTGGPEKDKGEDRALQRRDRLPDL